jgi:hypothetical protein
MNKYIIKKSDKKLNLKELNDLYNEQIVNNHIVGDVLWHREQKHDSISNETKEIIERIENRLINNNREFTRFPSDYIHGKLCLETYEKDRKSEFKINENIWRVHKLIEIPQKYFGIIYVNELKHQIVLAHRGLTAEISNFFKEESTLCNNINGIILSEIIPQLSICYEVAKEANELALRNNYFLSFTGYANGAWLAEYSNYFCVRFLGNPNTKAVLFDSPGIFYSEEKTKSNIIDYETDFDLRELNVINYLTEPTFSNSINKHVGKVFRIFVEFANEDEEKNFKKSIFDRIETIPKFGKCMCTLMKSSKYFFGAILAMFEDHQRLSKIVEVFDRETGKPKYFEKMQMWPLVKLTLDKNYKENFSKLINDKVCGLANLIPSPFKAPSKLILQKTVHLVANCLLENAAPGIHILFNLALELSKQNIDLKHFENGNFYSKMCALKIEKEKKNVKVDHKEFELKLVNSYEPKEIVNLTKSQELRILNDKKNVDWCLEKLHNASIDESCLSNVVYKHLSDLKADYSVIANYTLHFEKEVKIICLKKSNNATLTIDNVRERMIRLILIHPNIRNDLAKVCELKL